MFKCFYNSVKPDNTEITADFIHSEWMKRNPKQDYNASQHVSYYLLNNTEKQKDRDQINIIKTLITANPISENMTYHDYFEKIANIFGSIAHEKWRNEYEQTCGVGKTRIKNVSSGGQVNINCSWNELHLEWKKENLEAGHAAVYAYYKFMVPITNKQ
jgi:hypothetical protein